MAEIRMRHKTKYLLKLISILNVNGASYNDLKATVFCTGEKKFINNFEKKRRKFSGQTLSIVNKKMVYKQLNFRYGKKQKRDKQILNDRSNPSERWQSFFSSLFLLWLNYVFMAKRKYSIIMNISYAWISMNALCFWTCINQIQGFSLFPQMP